MTGQADRVLVTGGTGLLGSILTPALRKEGVDVRTASRSGTADYVSDLIDPTSVSSLLDESRPGVVVNLAALTNVDQCEKDPNTAYLSNTRTVENIVNSPAFARHGCYLIHLSTDQVYDGVGPHSEGSERLTNYYAFSKYAGDLVASRAGTVLRTNFFGKSISPSRPSLTDWIHQSLVAGATIRVFEDVLFNPLSIATLVGTITSVLQNRRPGVFNLGAHGGMSKADFAFAFAHALGMQTSTMSRGRVDEAEYIKAYRPKDMRMNCAKFEKAYGVHLPELLSEIRRVAKEYRGED